MVTTSISQTVYLGFRNTLRMVESGTGDYHRKMYWRSVKWDTALVARVKRDFYHVARPKRGVSTGNSAQDGARETRGLHCCKRKAKRTVELAAVDKDSLIISGSERPLRKLSRGKKLSKSGPESKVEKDAEQVERGAEEVTEGAWRRTMYIKRTSCCSKWTFGMCRKWYSHSGVATQWWALEKLEVM